MVLPGMIRVTVADAGVATESGLAEADAVGCVAALDAFHIPGDLANDAVAPRDRQSVHATDSFGGGATLEGAPS
jgi:hypothetical protein